MTQRSTRGLRTCTARIWPPSREDVCWPTCLSGLTCRGLPRPPRKLELSKTSFYRYLALLNAPPDIRQALQRGEIGVMQAEKLASVDDPEDRMGLLRVATQGTPQPPIDEDHDNQGEASPDGKPPVTDPGVYSSRGQPRRAGRQDPSWAARKSLELARTLGLDIEVLSRIRKALNPRQMTRPRHHPRLCWWLRALRGRRPLVQRWP